jgi:hypothetical protein
MIVTIPTRHEEITLVIKVFTHEPHSIRIKVVDAEQPNTTFTDRYKTVDGESIFFVRMPVSGKDVLVYVYNEANGSISSDYKAGNLGLGLNGNQYDNWGGGGAT